MDMRQAALDSVKAAAEELLKQAGSDQDEAVRGRHSSSLCAVHHLCNVADSNCIRFIISFIEKKNK